MRFYILVNLTEEQFDSLLDYGILVVGTNERCVFPEDCKEFLPKELEQYIEKVV